MEKRDIETKLREIVHRETTLGYTGWWSGNAWSTGEGETDTEIRNSSLWGREGSGTEERGRGVVRYKAG